MAAHSAGPCRAALEPLDRCRSGRSSVTGAGELRRAWHRPAGPTGGEAGVPSWPVLAVVAEELVQFGVADEAGEAVELALLGDLASRS